MLIRSPSTLDPFKRMRFSWDEWKTICVERMTLEINTSVQFFYVWKSFLPGLLLIEKTFRLLLGFNFSVQAREGPLLHSFSFRLMNYCPIRFRGPWTPVKTKWAIDIWIHFWKYTCTHTRNERKKILPQWIAVKLKGHGASFKFCRVVKTARLNFSKLSLKEKNLLVFTWFKD